MRIAMKLSAALVVVSIGMGTSLAQTTWFVPDDFPAGIQAALSGPSVADGDTIIVRPGTYIENIDFIGKAVTLRSEAGPQDTIIDGNDDGSVVVFATGEGPGSVLDGFTLRNGTGTNYTPYHEYGGGVFCSGTSPTIKNNIIREHYVDYGGGIACVDGADAAILENTISDNWANDSGGGIYARSSAPLIAENRITDNSCFEWPDGGFGGGIRCDYSAAIIRGNAILRNDSEYGGAITLIESSTAVLDNIIWRNGPCGVESRADVPGEVLRGNVIAYNESHGVSCFGALDVVENLIFANENTGVYCEVGPLRLASNVICSNAGGWFGGGISVHGVAEVVNCTIYGNSANKGGGVYFSDATVTIANTILWDNDALDSGPELYVGDGSAASITHSDVDGGQASTYVQSGGTLNWGDGMIDTDPLFAEQEIGDLHLTFSSPCKDAGNAAAVPPDLLEDVEGDPRMAGNVPDIGADEFYYHLYATGTVSPGNWIDIRVVGVPAKPVTLAMGSGIVDPPQSTQYGDLYLLLPVLWSGKIGTVPANGILIKPVMVPEEWIPGDEYPFQALVGPMGRSAARLTNLMVLKVK